MPDSSWLIRHGHIIDPANAVDTVADLRINNGTVNEIGSGLSHRGEHEFDASGRFVVPGLIDLHVHLRVPGQEHKETIASGTAAAAAGGFTTIACMPNTTPPLDSVTVVETLRHACEREALVRVLPIATISRERAGQEPVDFAGLAAAGVIGFSDDGDSAASSAVMRSALEASATVDKPVMVHCEDKALATGAMHEGNISRRLGVRGIPAVAEEIIIARDLMLARLTGGWLHVLHVSTGDGADMVLDERRRGTRVTAEVMPHHLTMTDAWVAGDGTLLHTDYPSRTRDVETPDPLAKVNPPLRTPADTSRLLGHLQRGTFDILATDHAPHAAEEKRGPIDRAAFGMSGLELALPLMLGLVRAGHLTMPDLVRRVSTEPARLFGLSGGSLAVGAPADVTVVDPDLPWVVSRETLKTKSPNTPLLGMTVRGRSILTLVGGQQRYRF